MEKILAVISKGLTIAHTLVDASEDVKPVLTAVKDLVTKTANNTVTRSDVEQTEATLDQMLTDFNTPMSDE